MGLLKLFGLKRWKPDLEREPSPKKEWPDHVLTLSSSEFDNFINKYPVSIVDFWAPWCRPCKLIVPLIRQLSRRYKGKVAFGRLNIDQNRNLAKRYHVLAIPNLVFFSCGEKITNIAGVRSIKELQVKIDDILMKFER